MPPTYYADFLRGYFDGDGTIYGYWDKRWPNSLMYYVGFASASPKFLLWLQATNQQLFGMSPGQIKPGARAEALTYAKADSLQLFARMYRDNTALHLTRKYQKFIDFLQADPYVKMVSIARVL